MEVDEFTVTQNSKPIFESEIVFYYDFCSPQSYLVAERILSELPSAEWQPVRQSELTRKQIFSGNTNFAGDLAHYGVGEVVDGDITGTKDFTDRETIELAAKNLHLQAFRWPNPFPFDSESVLLAATYAKQIGRGVAFSLSAFRQAFAGGQNLQSFDGIVIAAAACEMHPAALRTAIDLKAVKTRLQQATSAARAIGVSVLPSIKIGSQILSGDDCLEASKSLAQVG